MSCLKSSYGRLHGWCLICSCPDECRTRLFLQPFINFSIVKSERSPLMPNIRQTFHITPFFLDRKSSRSQLSPLTTNRSHRQERHSPPYSVVSTTLWTFRLPPFTRSCVDSLAAEESTPPPATLSLHTPIQVRKSIIISNSGTLWFLQSETTSRTSLTPWWNLSGCKNSRLKATR